MAAGTHPFPFRTRQLSPPAPMVLGGHSPGRVGRRRVLSMTMPAPETGRASSRLDDGSDRAAQYPSRTQRLDHSVAERPRRRREDDNDDDHAGPSPRGARSRDEATGPTACPHDSGPDRPPSRDRTGAATGRSPAGPASGRNGRGAARKRRAGRRGRHRPLKRNGQAAGQGDGQADRRAQRATDASARGHEEAHRRTRRDRDRSPTRSGIQYPLPHDRRAATPNPSRSRARRPERPVLRTVKGTPARAGEARPVARAPAKARTTAVPAAGAADRGRRRTGADRRPEREPRPGQLDRAAEAYTGGRERDAARILRPLRDAYPDAAAVRELLGLVHYRLGQYPGRVTRAHRVRRPHRLGRTASRPHGLLARATPLRQGRGALGGARAVVAVGRARDRRPHRARRRTGRRRPPAGSDRRRSRARPTT